MITGDARNQVIFTNKVQCGDCHRCLKTCPVNAISVTGSQAYIRPELCISCGRCVNECPLGAKQYSKDWFLALEDIENKDIKIAFSVDDNYVVYYRESVYNKIPSALKQLGSVYSAETSNAASIFYDTLEKIDDKDILISPFCFSVVSYVEKYKINHINNIAALPSPFIIHGSIIKNKFPEDNIKVIYIGPCLSKKLEAQRYSFIDHVLTFEEFDELLAHKSIRLDKLEDSNFDELPSRNSRLYYANNNTICSSLQLHAKKDNKKILHVTGQEDTLSAINLIDKADATDELYINAMICKHGCAHGPVSGNLGSGLEKRLTAIDYASKAPCDETQRYTDIDIASIHSGFISNPIPPFKKDLELRMSNILSDLGKVSNGVYLNCGACGFKSCGKAAEAILNNMADLDICVQRTKRKYKSMSGIVLQTSPNAIVTVDNNFSILNINPAFKSMFKCGDMILGKPISSVLDSEIYQRIQNGEGDMFDRVIKLDRYNMICHAIIYKVPKEDCMIGIYIDITKNEMDRERLFELKSTTAHKAKEMLEYQFKMFEHIVEYIGESSAKSEELVDNLLEIISKVEE